MSEVNIDDLSLKVSADASSADAALSRLVSSLSNVAGALDPAGKAFDGFIARLERVTASAQKLKDTLTKTKFNLDFQVQGRSSVDDIQRSIEAVKQTIDGSQLAEKLAEMYHFDRAAATKDAKETIEAILAEIAGTFNGSGTKVNEAAQQMMSHLWKIVKEDGRLARDEVRGTLGQAAEEAEQFLKDLERIGLSAERANQELGKGAQQVYGQYLSYIREGGRLVDGALEEFARDHTAFIDPKAIQDALSYSEQLQHIFEGIKAARAEINRQPISTFSKSDLTDLRGEFYADFAKQVAHAADEMRDALVRTNADLATQVKLDVKIDEQKVADDIKKALHRAVTVVTEPVPVNLKVNIKYLQDQIKKQIGPVDIGQLPQLAEVIEKFDKVDSSNVLKLGQAFGEFGKAKMVKAANNIRELGASLEVFSKYIANLNTVNFKIEGLPELVNSITALGRKSVAQAIENIPQLQSAIMSLIVTLSKAPTVSRNTVALVQALSTLPKATRLVQSSANQASAAANTFGSSLGAAFKSGVSGFTQLLSKGNLLSKTFQVMSSSLRMGTSAMKVLASGLKNASTRLKTAATNSKHFSTALKALSTVAKGASSVLNGIQTAVNVVANVFSKLASKLTSTAKPMDKIKNSLRGLLRTIIPIMGIRQIFNWGKNAVEISSDLTEVQNVVDTVFQNAAQSVDEFAARAIEDFGMSELTAKQVASRYQAMGTAMGILPQQVEKVSSALKNADLAYGTNAQSMADMSIELTKLTADMASFYNVEQEAVSEDLAAIFTGQTRPLRKYGLDLTQATLQEWALSQGMDANIKSMTQAQKTMLRYQYVMQNLGFVMKDYQYTQDTWANSTRRLIQQIQDLGKTVGTILINTFKPFVRTLNNVLASVRTFATEVLNALGQIFGWQIEVSPGGLAQDFDDAADAVDDMSDGLDDASKTAKEIKNTIMSFDELNVLNGLTDSGKNGSSSTDDLTSSIDATRYSIKRIDTVFKQYESDIKNLQQLGEFFANSIKKALGGIDWDKYNTKMKDFGKGLADFLNGLNDPEMFALAASTLGNGFNGIVASVNSFLTNFDASKLAASISAFIQNGFYSIDWNQLQTTAGNAGRRFGELINGVVTPTNARAIGQSIGKWFMTIVSFLENLVDTTDWDQIGESFGAGVEGFSEEFDGKRAGNVITKLGTNLGKLIQGAINKIPWNTIWAKLRPIISGAFSTAFKLITEVADPIFKKLGLWIGEKLGDVWGGIKEKLFGGFLDSDDEAAKVINETVGQGLLSPVEKSTGKTVNFFSKVLKKLDIGKAFEKAKIKEKLLGGFTDTNDEAAKLIKEKMAPGIIDSAAEALGKVGDFFKKMFGGNDQNSVKSKTISGVNNVSKSAEETLGSSGRGINKTAQTAFGQIPSTIASAMGNGLPAKITNWGNTTKKNVESASNMSVTTAAATFGGMPATIASKLVGVGPSVASTISKSFSSNKTSFTNTATTVGNYFKPISSNILKNSTVSGSSISANLDRLVKEYQQRTPSRISQIGSVFSPLRSKLTQALYVPGDNVSASLNQLLKEYEQRTPSRVSKIANVFAPLSEKIVNKSKVKGSDISAWADMTKDNFATRIGGKTGNGGIVGAITGGFSGVPWGIMQQVDKKWWFDDFQTNATRYISRNGSAIPNAIINQFDVRGRAYDTGEYVAQGFANGTGSWWSLNKVKEKAVEMASKFMTSVNNFFGVNSPAKLTMETGRYVGLGFLVGWESTFGQIMKSVSTFGHQFSSIEIAAPSLNTSGLASLSNAGINATATVGLDIESLHDAVVSGVEIALSGQQERPIYVNAELRTQNDEVLARAVTRGQRSIAYRSNPNAPVY